MDETPEPPRPTPMLALGGIIAAAWLLRTLLADALSLQTGIAGARGPDGAWWIVDAVGGHLRSHADVAWLPPRRWALAVACADASAIRLARLRIEVP